MTINSSIIAGLAGFDLFILTVLYFYLRSSSMERRVLIPIGAGLAAFVFHAFVFFSGAILYLHLATLASVFVLCFVSAFSRSDGKKSGS